MTTSATLAYQFQVIYTLDGQILSLCPTIDSPNESAGRRAALTRILDLGGSVIEINLLAIYRE